MTKSFNEAIPRKDIINFPSDPNKLASIQLITNTNEYQNATKFRNQLLILYDSSKNLENKIYKLSYKDLSSLFLITLESVKYHILKAREEAKGRIQNNGRPFSLNDIQIQKLKKWILKHPFHPKLFTVRIYIEAKFGQYLSYTSLLKVFDKVDLKTAMADPMDESRYYCDQHKIDYYFDLLYSYTQAHDIPSGFILNLDEEGHDSFCDKTKQVVVVQKELNGPFSYPVARKNNRTTFLACICADGEYLNPLIIIKRKTVDSRFLTIPLFDKVLIEYSESGYINGQLFDHWIENVFVPYIKEKRLKYKYDGPALLLLDGCSSHYTKKFFQACNDNNIKIFFLPPHSSHLTQPLDLCLFHLHKEKIRRLFLSIDDENVSEKILDLYSAFQMAANVKNIKSSFEATGAVYEASGSIFPIIHFSKDFSTKCSPLCKTKKDKKIIRQKREGVSNKRINIEDINLCSYFETSPKVKEISKKIPNIVNNKLDDVFHKILAAFLPVNKVENDQTELEINIEEDDDAFLEEIKKQKTKKQKESNKKEEQIETSNSDYLWKSFEEKLIIELESLGFNV